MDFVVPLKKQVTDQTLFTIVSIPDSISTIETYCNAFLPISNSACFNNGSHGLLSTLFN